MLHTRLDVDEDLCNPLILLLVALALRVGLAEMALELIHDAPGSQRPSPRVLDLLHLCFCLCLLLVQVVDACLGLLCHHHQVVVRLVLRQELLDHLVHIAHPCGILDFPEGLLVGGNLLLLLLQHVFVERAVKSGTEQALLHVCLPRIALLAPLYQGHLPPHFVALLHPLVHLHLLLHESTPVGELLLTLLLLLHQLMLQLE
mmetsp:Transcript_3929/g.8944  ORF Transcript_3929/g.8944 Transcript_3929/m.8944 type:complete len:202 (-) Transcript_3929:821-1426(-)